MDNELSLEIFTHVRRDTFCKMVNFRNTLINLDIIIGPLGMDWIYGELDLVNKRSKYLAKLIHENKHNRTDLQGVDLKQE